MILVTGGAGFLGRHLLAALRTRFPDEALLAVDLQPPPDDPPERVDFIEGSVEDSDLLARLADGADVVIHLAGLVQPNSRQFDQLWRVNVEGARNIHAAAVRAHSRLFVHLSSAGVYGPPHRGAAFAECDPAKPTTPYQRTKWEGEEAVRHAQSGATVVNVVRPAGIYGPGSQLELATYRKIKSQRWRVELPGGVVVHPTHVRDVVGALLALVENPAPHGSTFNVAGQCPIRVTDLHALVAEILRVRRKRLTLSKRTAGPLASAIDPLLARVGRRNPLMKDTAYGLDFTTAINDDRFRMRYPKVPVVRLEEGLREHIKWAVDHGLLERSISR